MGDLEERTCCRGQKREEAMSENIFDADVREDQHFSHPDQYFHEVAERNAAGTLTIGFAPFGYFELLEGQHKGRIVIKTNARIDGKPILFFADTLTWIYLDKLKDYRCVTTRPTFRG